MSFAKEKDRRSAFQLRQSIKNVSPTKYLNFASPKIRYLNHQQKLDQLPNFDQKLGQKLEILESNTVRIQNQNNCLQPLLREQSNISRLIDLEILSNQQKRNVVQTQDRIVQLELEIRELQKQMETSVNKTITKNAMINIEYQQIEKQIKTTNNHINALQSNLKDVEGTVLNLSKITEQKFKNEFSHITKTIDSKILKSKNEILQQIEKFRKEVAVGLQQQDKQTQQNYSQKSVRLNSSQKETYSLNEDVKKNVERKIQNFVEKLNLFHEKDIQTLYRDLGVLRCEFELFYDQSRKQNLASHIVKIPAEADPQEKRIKVNNLEQAIFIYELDKFNKENTQRLISELNQYETKLNEIKENIEEIQEFSEEEYMILQQEIEFSDDKFQSYRYQLEGIKKKYLFDMKRIEEKMEKLSQLKNQASQQQNKALKKMKIIPDELKVIEQFPEKIKFLMESINKNLETIYKKFQYLEEKLNQNKEQFFQAFNE